MTNTTLWRLLWRRYRVLLGTALVVMGLVGIKAATDLVGTVGNLFTKHGYITGNADSLLMFMTFVVVTVLGWAIFAWDHHTDFNHYLFALPVTRRRIYRQKLQLLLTTVAGSYVLMHGLFLGVLGLIKRSTMTYNLNWDNDLRYCVSQLMFLLAVLMVAMTCGLWLGQIFASALTTVIFMASWLFAINGFSTILMDLTGIQLWRVHWIYYFDQSTWSGFSILVLGSLAVIVALYYLDRWAFEHLSLEETGEYFLLPQFRQTLLWLVIVYLTVAVSFSSFGHLIIQMVTNHYVADLPLYQNVLLAVVVAYLTWSIGRLILYRPDQVRTAFKFKKIA